METIATGLSELHSMNLVHGDLSEFLSYESWGNWGPCIQKAATVLHTDVQNQINPDCKKTENDCKEKIIADCLNPDPTQRPTSEQLKNRLSQLPHPSSQ